MLPDKIYKYELRERTLEEVSDLLDAPLVIRRMRKMGLWFVKLEGVMTYDPNPSKRKYLICKSPNPNYALSLLCDKISYKTVVIKNRDEHKVVRLDLVKKGQLYLRLNGSE